MASKSNEITAIPVLLEQLALAGCIVSIDAMGTQRAIAEQITQQQADYVLALKGNHPTLLEQAQAGFKDAQTPQGKDIEQTQYQDTEAGHHRIESRTIWQISAAHVFSKDPLQHWAGLQRLVVVQSHRRLWNKDTTETRYFLSSLRTDAQTFARYIRAHWGVENQLHGCLDVVFKEARAFAKTMLPEYEPPAPISTQPFAPGAIEGEFGDETLSSRARRPIYDANSQPQYASA